MRRILDGINRRHRSIIERADEQIAADRAVPNSGANPVMAGADLELALLVLAKNDAAPEPKFIDRVNERHNPLIIDRINVKISEGIVLQILKLNVHCISPFCPAHQHGVRLSRGRGLRATFRIIVGLARFRRPG